MVQVEAKCLRTCSSELRQVGIGKVGTTRKSYVWTFRKYIHVWGFLQPPRKWDQEKVVTPPSSWSLNSSLTFVMSSVRAQSILNKMFFGDNFVQSDRRLIKGYIFEKPLTRSFQKYIPLWVGDHSEKSYPSILRLLRSGYFGYFGLDTHNEFSYRVDQKNKRIVAGR